VGPQGVYTLIIDRPFAAGDTSSEADIQGVQAIRDHYQQIKNKQLILYYFGTLQYEDIFGSAHSTNYCVFLAEPDHKGLAYCQAFNDLN
jgi:hypothetical protein